MGIRDNFRQAIDEMIGAKPNDLTVSDEQIANGQALLARNRSGIRLLLLKKSSQKRLNQV
jgi:hypothetical protein